MVRCHGAEVNLTLFPATHASGGQPVHYPATRHALDIADSGLGELMHTLIYTSVATHPMPASELHALLAEARLSNAQLGITGMLLYKDGNFMQVLEGEHEVVNQLSRRIARDARHVNVFTLHSGSIDARQFPDWSMGFRDLAAEPPLEVPGYSEFMTLELTAETFLPEPGRAYRLLRTFRDS
jgi:hypothetical protein